MGFGIRKNVDAMSLAGNIVKAIVGLWVCSLMVTILTGVVDTTNATGVFYDAYQFLGVNAGTDGVLTIAGIFVALSVLASVIEFN